uniref:Uncharacterized protein n=1 Tax=Romanomermis culicivorax TaxID=13658 RepID=A0A915KF38_ROMCU
MSQEIVVQQRLEKNELEKSILKVRGEEQEEEEEEEEDYDDSLKAKTTVKFVVESDDHSKDFTKLIIESSSKLSPQIESGLNEFFGTKINIQSLEHFKRDGLLENEILTENHQVIVELPQSSSSITVAENNIERTVDRVEERILESEKIIDQQENSEVECCMLLDLSNV